MKTARTLSAVRMVGPWRLAAIEETAVSAWAAPGRIGGSGGKRPVAILIDGPGGLRGTDAGGVALEREEIERLLPGVLSRFAAVSRADSELQDKEDRP